MDPIWLVMGIVGTIFSVLAVKVFWDAWQLRNNPHYREHQLVAATGLLVTVVAFSLSAYYFWLSQASPDGPNIFTYVGRGATWALVLYFVLHHPVEGD